MSMNTGGFKVIFRGVRGSYPITSANSLKYGGNTACVEIRVNGHLIILDAGTGIINLGYDLIRDHIASGSDINNRKPVNAVVLFSHVHTDHIQGIPFFQPVYLSTSNIYMYGPRYIGIDFDETIEQYFFAPFFPVDLQDMPASIYIDNIKENDKILLHEDQIEPEYRKSDSNEKIPDETVVIETIKSYSHPKDGVLVYKISYNGKSLVYATDKEGYIGGDSRLTSFARNADLLIHDAQYTQEDYASLTAPRQGFGHSTSEMAIETAKFAGVKKLVLFHHDPTYNDIDIANIEENSIKQFKNTIAAYEGLEINLI